MDITYVGPKTFTAAEQQRLDAAHEQRLRLIDQPFPPIGRPGLRIPSYPWSGTIIGNNFFGDGEDGHRHRKRSTEGDYDPNYTAHDATDPEELC